MRNKTLLAGIYLYLSNHSQVTKREQTKLTVYMTSLGGFFFALIQTVTVLYQLSTKSFRDLKLAKAFFKLK